MSRKIYIYNRAALLYKRGASLRNWMQKVRLHRAAFHFPRASPNVMKPCIFSFVETSHFFVLTPFSLLWKPHNFFGKGKRAETSILPPRWLLHLNQVQFLANDTELKVAIVSDWRNEKLKYDSKIDVKFPKCVVSCQEEERKENPNYRFTRGQSSQTATHERSESIRKRETNQRYRWIQQWASDLVTIWDYCMILPSGFSDQEVPKVQVERVELPYFYFFSPWQTQKMKKLRF